jgi:hypothetical protein
MMFEVSWQSEDVADLNNDTPHTAEGYIYECGIK